MVADVAVARRACHRRTAPLYPSRSGNQIKYGAVYNALKGALGGNDVSAVCHLFRKYKARELDSAG